MQRIEHMNKEEAKREVLFYTNEWKPLHFMLERMKNRRDYLMQKKTQKRAAKRKSEERLFHLTITPAGKKKHNGYHCKDIYITVQIKRPFAFEDFFHLKPRNEYFRIFGQFLKKIFNYKLVPSWIQTCY